MLFVKKRSLIVSTVFLLLLLLITDITVYKTSIFEAFGEQFLNEERTQMMQERYQAVEESEQHRLDFPGKQISEVVFNEIHHKMTVQPAAGTDVGLEYTVKVYAKDEAAAEQKLNEVAIQDELSGGTLNLSAEADGQPIDPDYFAIEYTLLLPEGVNVKLDSHRGAIHIKGVQSDVEAHSVRGLVDITNVTGTVQVKSTDDHVYIANVNGDVELESERSMTTISEISGSIVLQNRQSSTFIDGIAGKVVADTQYGSLQLRQIKGRVDISDREGEIQMAELQNHVELRSTSGHVQLTRSDELGYRFDIQTNGGTIMTNLPIVVEKGKADTERLQGTVGDGQWKIDAALHAGQITIH